MNRAASTLTAFHLIGDRSGLPAEKTGRKQLRPALFAAYRDLSQLRYDFPMILVGGDPGFEWIKSLADTIDATLHEIAPQGIEGEQSRRQLLSLEQEIRNLLAQGQTGALSVLWDRATCKLLSGVDESMAGALRKNLAEARREIGFDGEIVDCDRQLPARLISHAWQRSQRVKTVQLRTRIDGLVQKLADILRANYMRSPEARGAGHLESSLGAGNQVVFDFQAMAGILKSAPVGRPLPEKRRRRIKEAISVLKSQNFAAVIDGGAQYRFDFDNCSEALAAFRQRLPEMAALVKAISIAELDIENSYDESQHDSFYSHFDEKQLGPGDLALFPSYLVNLEDGDDADSAQTIFDIFRAGLPFKIVDQADNIVGEQSITSGGLCFGIRGQQLATMAMGLNYVFVLQAAASSLYRLRGRIMDGLDSDRPALFSVYSGINRGSIAADNNLPPYLLAAAATESRTFPCFICDPASGNDLLSRFHLDGNPRAEQDWCRHPFQYEDAEHNTYTEQSAFSVVDFMACDGRYADHFARVTEAEWDANMLPVDAFLDLDSKSRSGKVPYVLLIDEDDVLYRAVCDDRSIDAARCCRDLWRSLQELGGINNSHVLQALARAKEASAASVFDALAATTAAPLVATATEPQATPPAVAPAVEPPASEFIDVSSGDAWIETIRCTTCNECTQINGRMFAYDEDQRAYIADPNAGTYREMVEAAETCQVAIIHPGKPRNPDEPGVEELMERAEPFNA